MYALVFSNVCTQYLHAICNICINLSNVCIFHAIFAYLVQILRANIASVTAPLAYTRMLKIATLNTHALALYLWSTNNKKG